jgi:hypothetical protein
MAINKNTDIIPETKISRMLEQYPELEPVLMEMAPAFNKLRNPVLRRTVAKVANLRQAAELGKIPLGKLINRLRKEAGLPENHESREEKLDGLSAEPDWVTTGKIIKSLDARPLLEAGAHPIDMVMRELQILKNTQLFELITPFVPSPLIDMAKTKGFRTFTKEKNAGLIRTYFGKK